MYINPITYFYGAMPSRIQGQCDVPHSVDKEIYEKHIQNLNGGNRWIATTLKVKA